MSITDHELQMEQARVDRVIQAIDDQIAQTKLAVEKAHAETRAVEKNYGANTSINRYEIDDIAESRAEIEQQRRLLFQASENEDILKRQLATLQELKQSPYFGRIDILDPGEKEPESLYIGVASLMNNDKSDFLIYDWRAPISGVYYNGTLGTVTYPTPNGFQTTKLVKKRQFTIVDGKITNMFDTNETVGDEMLQAALGRQNDQYMQSIVATIQQEQNDIIRNTTSDLLVVQGVAGSGKTSAILQRIAYLLFHSRDSLNADQIVLFSPNLLFSQYISQVLPKLGEKNMRQVTLAGFLRRRFEGLKVETLFERYEKGLTTSPTQKYLESAAIMKAVEAYLVDMKAKTVQPAFVPITFNETPFFTAKHIQAIYDAQSTSMAVADRLLATKNALIKELKGRIREEAKKDWVAKEMDELTTQQITTLMGKHTVDDFNSPEHLNRYLARRWARKRLRTVYDALYNNYFIDFYAQYHNFLQTLPVKNAKQIAKNYYDQLEWHQISLVHTAPLMYLRDLISASGINRAFQYVFIDEMQDYSPAMLVYLHHAFPLAKFTILGDSEQALFYPLELPEELLQQTQTILAAKHPRLVALRRSYRSTKEITDFAKALLPDGDQIISFTRHGEVPELIMANTIEDWQANLIKAVKKARSKYPTLALLTKNQGEAKKLYQLLYGQVGQLTMLSDQDSSLPTGVIILPTYLAKGLEFDAVIIPDVSEQVLTPNDTGLLYTMASRAMHQLTILSQGPLSPVITPAARKLVQVKMTNLSRN